MCVSVEHVMSDFLLLMLFCNEAEKRQWRKRFKTVLHFRHVNRERVRRGGEGDKLKGNLMLMESEKKLLCRYKRRRLMLTEGFVFYKRALGKKGQCFLRVRFRGLFIFIKWLLFGY